jgi:hypothetical protein
MFYKVFLIGSLIFCNSKADFQVSSLMLEVSIFAFAYNNHFKSDFSNYALIAISLFNVSKVLTQNSSFEESCLDPNEMEFKGF